jgi:hypothetical protein
VNKTIKGACLVAATAMLPLSQAAKADVNISGWVNEGAMYYDDGASSDIVQSADNGTTLNSRISFTGSHELPNSGLSAGFEISIEPSSGFNPGLFGGSTPLAVSNQSFFGDDNNFLSSVTVLASNIWVSGSFGKLTIGTQSMPTDNIGVLEDPSVTLWANISPVFRGNSFTINNGGGTGWGNWLNCFTTPGLQIGFDCNGVYRNGIRYDLPAFGPVTVAVGYANDDIYDVAAKYKGTLGGLNTSLALGYAMNQGPTLPTGLISNAATTGLSGTGGDAFNLQALPSGFDETEIFQVQLGVMDPGTGLFGAISYQHEEADLSGTPAANVSDDTDAWYFKGGIKRDFNSLGPTSFHFAYGSYNDQYDATRAAAGVTGSEVERISFGVTQYFGAAFQIYGTWEQLDLDVDCGIAATAATCNASFGNADELDMFNLGATYFF